MNENQNTVPPVQQTYQGSPTPPLQNEKKNSGLSIAGLILSLIIPIVGLIISIFALVKANKNDESKTCAIIGLVIGLINVIVQAIILIVAIPTVLGSMNTAQKSAMKIQSQKYVISAQTLYEEEKVTKNYTGKQVKVYSSADSSTTATGVYGAYCYTVSQVSNDQNPLSGYIIVTEGVFNSEAYGYFTSEKANVSGITSTSTGDDIIKTGKSTDNNIKNSTCPDAIYNWAN